MLLIASFVDVYVIETRRWICCRA